MFKKIVLTCLIICSVSVILFACYDAWNSAFSAAYGTYLDNIDRCSSAAFTTMCMLEAQAIYGAAVESASDAFYTCLK